jgi:dTDP-4-dehydrorhamnose reductase
MNRVLVVGQRGMLGSDLMDLLAGKGLRREPLDVARGPESVEGPVRRGKGDRSLLCGAPFRAYRQKAPVPFSQASFVGADLPEIDITDPDSIGTLLDGFRPDLVINCAAYTRVDDAESNRDEAMRVNAEGALNVASAAASSGAKVVHISTDFVFDGRKSGAYRETDRPAPLSVYGESKLEGERLVARSAKDHLIVRTAWLYGRNGRNFVTTIIEQARQKPELTVVDDQRGCPTWTRDLSRAIWELCKADARGIVHAAGRGSCSWYEFAVEIVRQAGLKTRVRPITSWEWVAGFAAARDDAGEPKCPAVRPANSALDTSLLTRLTAFEFPRWQDSLARFLEEVRRGSR